MGGIVVGHWKPNVTIALVEDFTAYPDAQIPPPVRHGTHLLVYSQRREFDCIFCQKTLIMSLASNRA
jgi:hypothetical protein